MANFPSVLNVFTRPTTTDKLNSPSHSGLHNTVSSALGQVEAFLGVIGASSVVGTLSYDVRSPASGGGGHVQFVNKGGTGQTTFTKGDILVAQSASVLTKLAITTTDNYALIADASQAMGVKWGIPGGAPTVRVYSTASTLTWTRPSALSYIIVETQGGGGGGGGGAPDLPCRPCGGGGGYARKIIAASSILASQTIIVGVAGPIGSIGGVSSFGNTSIMAGLGGLPGVTVNRGDAAGGEGGESSGGVLNIKGGWGENAWYSDTSGGATEKAFNSNVGGSTPFGNGSYGSGGPSGTVGGGGVVIVTEY